jgi:TM2 domain-containing membrane protein YozV
MGQMITKPDANPILYALLNGCGIGYFLMGQKKKAIITAVIVFVALPIFSIITCSIGSIAYLACFAFAYDAYLLGQKLQSGQAIGENENGLEFLNMIFKD